MKIDKKIILLTVFTYLFLMSATIPSNAATSTVMYVDPSETLVLIGETMSINISVSEVEDLCAWEFKMYYRNDILNATGIAEGPFLKTGGDTFFGTVDFDDTYNATHGRVWVTGTLLGSMLGVNGSGSLATVSFKSKVSGDTDLSLADSLLVDSEDRRIPHIVVNGAVHVRVHKVAIINITPVLPYGAEATYPGWTVSINATVRNEGNFDETFNITVYYDNNTIGTQNVTNLPPEANKTVTITWKTLGVDPSPYNSTGGYYIPYTISVNISSPTLGEIKWYGVAVTVRRPGDANGDGYCGIGDLAILGGAWNQAYPSPYYKWKADFNGDGKVYTGDLAILGMNYQRY